MNKRVLFLLTISLMLASGCSLIMPKTPAANPLRYYRYQGADLSRVGRVVMLELKNLSSNPQLGNDITVALAEEIQKKQIFGLDTIYPTDPQWKSADLGSSDEYSKEQLSDFRTKLKADALLFGKIIHYRPYPRNSVGLKLQLVDCRTGQLLWAIDQVWDSTDAAVEKRIESFFTLQMRSGYDPMQWKLTMLSPRIYNKFVAYEIARTLE